MICGYEENYMRVIHAPNEIDYSGTLTVFLAGSIEMGKAADWQTGLTDQFKYMDDIIFLNPRRPEWDASWEQVADNPQFREQVEWELEGMEKADIIFYYFDPKTKSPVSLLKLGLYANTEKDIVVCCPDGFHRKGNVDIVCDNNYAIVYDNLEEATHMLSIISQVGK